MTTDWLTRPVKHFIIPEYDYKKRIAYFDPTRRGYADAEWHCKDLDIKKRTISHPWGGKLKGVVAGTPENAFKCMFRIYHKVGINPLLAGWINTLYGFERGEITCVVGFSYECKRNWDYVFELKEVADVSGGFGEGGFYGGTYLQYDPMSDRNFMRKKETVEFFKKYNVTKDTLGKVMKIQIYSNQQIGAVDDHGIRIQINCIESIRKCGVVSWY